MDYDDLRGLVEYLPTYSKEANKGVNSAVKKPNVFKRVGEILGLSFAVDNPRAMIKSAEMPLGNLPMELLTYLQSYVDSAIDAGMLKAPIYQMQSGK
jgi:putative membrane protein